MMTAGRGGLFGDGSLSLDGIEFVFGGFVPARTMSAREALLRAKRGETDTPVGVPRVIVRK